MLDIEPSYLSESSLGGRLYGSRVNNSGAVADLFHENFAGGLRLELIRGEGEQAKITAKVSLSNIGSSDVLVGYSNEGAHGI